MNSDNFLYEYWKNEDVNELVRRSEIKDAKNYTANEFIKNMLKKNLDLSTISEISGKSKEEIKTLQKQLIN